MKTPDFSVALFVEFVKLRRSLALVLVVVAPALIAAFLLATVLRSARGLPWETMLQTSAAIWAFFLLPMSVTALTVLVAQTEHGPRAWDTLRALPLPRWHLYAAKAIGVLTLVLLMSGLLALFAPAAIAAGARLNPIATPTGAINLVDYVGLLSRMFLASWLLVAVQLWIALRYPSFVPALTVGIGGTFFAVVASSAKIGAVLPWQIPINLLASDPERALLALVTGALGGSVALVAMLWHLSRREVV